MKWGSNFGTADSILNKTSIALSPPYLSNMAVYIGQRQPIQPMCFAPILHRPLLRWEHEPLCGIAVILSMLATTLLGTLWRFLLVLAIYDASAFAAL